MKNLFDKMNGLAKTLMLLVCVFTMQVSFSGTITLKFTKSLNEDGPGNRSAYCKIEANQKQYELELGTDKKYTNISVRAHSIVVSASGKSKRLVGEATWSGSLTKKQKLLITSVKATSTKDRSRGEYGIDLNSGWQVADVIVEITDTDKDKVIKCISGTKKPYKEFFDETGNLKSPTGELNEDVGYNDNTMSIVENKPKSVKNAK